MPTLITSFTDSEIKMRFREPYVTEGLNAKLAVNTPPGTYRGFRLSTNGTNNFVTVVADSGAADHVAVYQTDAGHSLTLRRTGGNFNLDLTALVDGTQRTWVIALRADYALGATTTAVIRAYQLSPVDEFTGDSEVNELVVLGTVIVPAGGGAISAANIKHDKRSYAWKPQATDAKPWASVVRNGGFELSWDSTLGDFSTASAYWRRATTAGAGFWISETTTPRTGLKCLAWRHGTAAGTSSCEQLLFIPVYAGQLVRYQFYKRAAQILTGGTVSFILDFRDADGTYSSTTVSVSLAATDGSYVEVEGTVATPASMTVLEKIRFVNSAANFGTINTIAYRLDDVQVWVEGDAQGSRDVQESRIGDGVMTGLSVVPDTNIGDIFIQKAGALFRYDPLLGMEDVGGLLLRDLGGSDLLPSPSISQIVGNGVTYTLIREVRSGGSHYREYVNFDGVCVKTLNAVWSNSTNLWTKDQNGVVATRIDLGDGVHVLKYQTAGTNSWADGSWTADLLSTTLTSNRTTFDTSASNGFEFLQAIRLNGPNLDFVGDSRWTHGNYVESVPGPDGWAVAGTWTFTSGGVSSTTTSAQWNMPVRSYYDGHLLVSVSVRLVDRTTDVTAISLRIISDSGSTSNAGSGWSANSAGSGVAQTVTMTGASPYLVDGSPLVVAVNVEGTGGASASVYWAKFTFAREGL